MKLIIGFSVALFIFTHNASAQTEALSPDRITGWYWSPEKNAKIEVGKIGNEYNGFIRWTALPVKDTKNPDPELRIRDIAGIQFLSGFHFERGEYLGGKIYDPKNGKTYDCKMTINGDDIQVRAFLGFSLFGRTEIFTRLK